MAHREGRGALIMKNFLLFSLFAILFISPIHSFETSPWFGNDHEIETKVSYAYQKYKRIDAQEGIYYKPSEAHFIFLNTGVSILGNYNVEAALNFMKNEAKGLDLESLSCSSRYLFYNDLIGEPFSLVFGLQATCSPSSTLSDPGVLHHAYADGELHISFGKELSNSWNWDQRYWGLFALGKGNKGKAWIRGIFAWEKNIEDVHLLKLFLESQHGLGNEKLRFGNVFPGYRCLGYSILDLGVKYSYIVDFFGRFDIELSRRIHARYAPEGVNKLAISLFYPFSL